AIEYLREAFREGRDEPGAMITIQEGQMEPLPFGSFSDPETGRVRVREVNVDSHSYRVAREYMIRLERQDLDDRGTLDRMASVAGTTPEDFVGRYGYLVGAGTSG